MTRDNLTLTAERPAYGGLAIARHGGKVVMIKGAIPGETVEARVESEKKGYITATAVDILDSSPDRVAPPCPYFGECGGCQLQYIDYARQVLIKHEVLRDCLRRIAKADIELSETVSGCPWNYRHRAQFKLSGGKTGFYRERSRDVVDIEACPLMVKGINDLLSNARELAGMSAASELHISIGSLGGASALVKASRGAVADWDGLADALAAAGFTGALVVDGGKTLSRFGEGRISLELDGLEYEVSPTSFFQANWALNREVVGIVKDWLGPLSGKRVLDLYAGAGNFALPLAGAGAKVVAVEENRSAVKDGEHNLKVNRIDGCRFVPGSAERFGTHAGFDALVMDPPRTGLTDGAVKRILEAGAGKIAYLSCNPSTFARDIRALSGRYRASSVRLVDFFPQTYHIECLGLLERRG